jgi:hypothetical protein
VKVVRTSVLSAAVLLTAVLTASAQGTEPGFESAPAPLASGPSPIWGSGSTSLMLGMAEFEARNGANSWGYSGVGYVTRTAGTDLIWANVNLPNGAFIEGIDAFFSDNSASATGRMLFTRFFGTNSFEDIGNATTPAGTPGFTTVSFDVNRTVDNTNTYVVYLDLPIDAALTCKGVRIRYHLQVSPAPATATFNDVDTTHPFFRFVEALASSGITGGCGGGAFCPDEPVTRGQMAVFLSTALGLHWPN